MASVRFGAVHVKQFKMQVDDKGNTTYKMKAIVDDNGTKDKDAVETMADLVGANSLTLKTTLTPKNDVVDFKLKVSGNSANSWGQKTKLTVDATPETDQEYARADNLLQHIKSLPEELVEKLRTAMSDNFFMIK